MFAALPSDIGKCTSLQSLNLGGCANLTSMFVRAQLIYTAVIHLTGALVCRSSKHNRKLHQLASPEVLYM